MLKTLRGEGEEVRLHAESQLVNILAGLHGLETSRATLTSFPPTCPLNTAFLETPPSSTSTSLDMQGRTAAGTCVEWLARGSRESPSSHSRSTPMTARSLRAHTQFLLARWRPVDNIDWTGLD